MPSDYLRKTVGDRRTGANLVGISVDTNNMNNLAPSYIQAFSQLEAFAKDFEDIKIKNEQTKLGLELAKQKLEFEEKYLSDPMVYSDDDKYTAMLQAYEQYRKDGEKLISDSFWLNGDMKRNLSDRNNISYSEKMVDILTKRNEVYIKRTIDDTYFNIDGMVNLAMQVPYADLNSTSMYIGSIKESLDSLVKIGVKTEGAANLELSKYVADIDAGTIQRRIENEIINNNDLSIEDKQKAVNEVLKDLKGGRTDKIVENLSKEYNLDDKAKEYLRAKLKTNNDALKKHFEVEMYKASSKDNTIKQLNSMQEKQNSLDNKIMKAYEANDPFKMIKAVTGLDLTTQEMISPDNSAMVEGVYGYTMANFGNKDSSVIGKVVSDVGISEINKAFADMKADKTIPQTTRNFVNGVIEPFIAKNVREFGDNGALREGATIAMRKDLGARIKGMNPVVLIKGAENPNYYDVWDTLEAGKGADYNFKTSEKILAPRGLSAKALRNYNSIVKHNLGNGIDFHSLEKAKIFNRYLVGLVNQRRGVDMEIKTSSSGGNYLAGIEQILEDRETVEYIKNNVLVPLYNLKVSPINYSEVQILPYQRQNGKTSEVKADGQQSNEF